MALDEWQRDVIERLTRIETMLLEDHKDLHGNGQPGLITRVANVEAQVQQMQTTAKVHTGWITHIIGGVGWLIAIITSTWGALSAKHG